MLIFFAAVPSLGQLLPSVRVDQNHVSVGLVARLKLAMIKVANSLGATSEQATETDVESSCKRRYL
jgi:hypothetical protein